MPRRKLSKNEWYVFVGVDTVNIGYKTIPVYFRKHYRILRMTVDEIAEASNTTWAKYIKKNHFYHRKNNKGMYIK